MKKICLISDRNIYMKRICNFLAENEYEVHLICRHKGGLSKTEFHPTVRIYQLSSNAIVTKFREIRNLLNQIQPHIVHLHYLTRDSFIPAIKCKRKYQFYITIWGSDLNIYAKNYINRFFQNLGLILCDKIHLLSPYFERQIQKTFFAVHGDKITIYSWGIDVASFQQFSPQKIVELKQELGIGNNDPVILSYRNHKPLYNHHLVIRAMPEILKKYPQAKFIFTRSNSWDENYIQSNRKLAVELNAEDNFIFIERWLNDEELKALVNMADITLNIPLHDGLPATLLEIMATKSIPIVSDLTNYHPFFTDQKNGLYLKKDFTERQLSDLIISALNNKKYLAEKFYKNNIDYIRRYQDWNKMKDKLLLFYEQEN